MPPQRARAPAGPATLFGAAAAPSAKPKVARLPPFLRILKIGTRYFKSFGRGAKWTEPQQEAVNFLGWDITPEEFRAGEYAILFIGEFLGILALVGIVAAFQIDVTAFEPTTLLAAMACLFAPLIGMQMFARYPLSAVNKERVQAIAYVPEIVNYLTMSMRLTPNLERAVEFAASHGRGKIAEDLKSVIWSVQVGRFLSVEEALDDLAYRWGPYNEDFKHALMLIRSSVLETDRVKREQYLEKAVQDVLDGSREKMDLYARALHQPTVYLYYFGILLPLMLAIILPIGGSLTGLALSRPEYMFMIYCVVLPVGVYLFGGTILGGRPPTYVPPDIPEDFPGLPRKGIVKIKNLSLPYKTIAWAILIAALAAGWWLDQNAVASLPEYVSTGAQRVATLQNIPHVSLLCPERGLFQGRVKVCDPAEGDLFIGLFTIFGLLLGSAFGLGIYLFGKYYNRKQVQDDIRNMEVEFKDAMYVLASRLGENRPIEEAMKGAMEFLPKSRIAGEVFRRILDNIRTLAMTLEAAVFDPTYGAAARLPSEVLRSGLKILVDAVELGVGVAAKSLIGLSMQLRNSQKIDEMLKKLLSDITQMLRTMATFVAPIVLGVVSAMQRLIVTSLAGAAGAGGAEQAQLAGAQGFGGISSLFKAEALSASADPATFSLILGIYVLEVTAILTFFNAQIEDTNNPLHAWTSVATSLPLAALLYCAVVFATSNLITTVG
jgi:hypothetical protein